MPMSAAAAANVVLAACEERSVAPDPMKLQKLLYLTHGYYSAVSGEPLINEPFEAWDYGPVVPSVYRWFKAFGSRPIKSGYRMEARDNPIVDPLAKRVLDFVLDKYGSKSAIYLSELTHKIGSPWADVKASPDGRRFKNIDIPFESIRSYFGKLVANPADA